MSEYKKPTVDDFVNAVEERYSYMKLQDMETTRIEFRKYDADGFLRRHYAALGRHPLRYSIKHVYEFINNRKSREL